MYYSALPSGPLPGELVTFNHYCPVCHRAVYRDAWKPPNPKRPCSRCRAAHDLVGHVLKEHGDEIADKMANDDALWDGLDKIRAGTHRKCRTEGCTNLIEIVRRRGRPQVRCDNCRS